MDIMDLFMDFNNHSKVSTDFEYRFFGEILLKSEDYAKWEKFGIENVDSFYFKDKVYKPMLELERRLIFNSNKHHDKVKIRGQNERVDISRQNARSLKNDLFEIIKMFVGAMNQYKDNKNNKNNQENQNNNGDDEVHGSNQQQQREETSEEIKKVKKLQVLFQIH